MTDYDSFKHAGLTVRICAEEYIDDNDNPRKNQDGNIGVMFCEHSRYDLGDEDAEDPRGHKADCEACGGSGESERWVIWDNRAYGKVAETGRFATEEGAKAYIALNAPADANWSADRETCPKCEGDGEIELSLTDYLKSIGCRVALPLFLYDHSGITMRCGANLLAGKDNFDRRGRYALDSAGWDVSSVGLIYHSPELCERWGRPESDDAKIEEELRNEVEAYATYLEGGVYRYQVLQAVERDGELVDSETDAELHGLDDAEVLDSCGGFLDADIHKDDCCTRQEARRAAEACREALKRERAEAHAMACRDIVTTA